MMGEDIIQQNLLHEVELMFEKVTNKAHVMEIAAKELHSIMPRSTTTLVLSNTLQVHKVSLPVKQKTMGCYHHTAQYCPI